MCTILNMYRTFSVIIVCHRNLNQLIQYSYQCLTDRMTTLWGISQTNMIHEKYFIHCWIWFHLISFLSFWFCKFLYALMFSVIFHPYVKTNGLISDFQEILKKTNKLVIIYWYVKCRSWNLLKDMDFVQKIIFKHLFP